MIDYNYYTTLDDKDLEKIIIHVKNIQHQRNTTFDNLFLTKDIEKITPFLSTVNQNKLDKVFQSYVDQFDASAQDIDFYLFLKKNEFTKNLSFSDLEEKICWGFATPTLLNTIKEFLPDTFTSFKNQQFQYHNKDLISYLHKNNFIDFDLVKSNINISNTMISYMLDNNMFKKFEDLHFNSLFHLMNEDVLSQVRSHFSLDKINFEEVYSQSNAHSMKSYLKESFKYKSPDFLEHFTITPFFVQQFASTIDKVSDHFKPLDFILKLYSLIQENNPSEQQQFFDILKQTVKKPANKELLTKAELNFNLLSSLSEKNIKSLSHKI